MNINIKVKEAEAPKNNETRIYRHIATNCLVAFKNGQKKEGVVLFPGKSNRGIGEVSDNFTFESWPKDWQLVIKMDIQVEVVANS